MGVAACGGQSYSHWVEREVVFVQKFERQWSKLLAVRCCSAFKPVAGKHILRAEEVRSQTCALKVFQGPFVELINNLRTGGLESCSSCAHKGQRPETRSKPNISSLYEKHANPLTVLTQRVENILQWLECLNHERNHERAILRAQV